MSKIKTREKVKDIKALDRSATLGQRMKNTFIRSKDQAANLMDDGQATPNEYAEDKVQYAAEDISRDTARAAVKGTKTAVQHGKKAIQRHDGTQAEKTAPREESPVHSDTPHTSAAPEEQRPRHPTGAGRREQRPPTAKNADSPVRAADPSDPIVERGRQFARGQAQNRADTAREIKTREIRFNEPEIKTRDVLDATQPIESVGHHPVDTMKQTAQSSGRTTGKTIKTQRQTVKTAQQTSGAAVKTTERTSEAAIMTPQRTAQTTRQTSGAAVKTTERTSETAIKTAKGTIKTPQRTVQTARQTSGAAFKTAERTSETPIKTAKTAKRIIKTPQRTVKTARQTSRAAVKTAERTSKTAIKTAEHTAKVAQKAAQASAKAARIAAQTARATAKAAATAAKATAKAVAAAVKAIIAAVKALVAAIAAGGWVAVLVIVIICLIGLIVASCFGIFFSGEDTGTGQTMRTVVREINQDYEDKLEEIKTGNPYDILEMSGSRAVWPEVLAIYAVKTTTDPDNGQEVASMDNGKKALLKEIFWEMNEVTYFTRTTSHDVVTETDDGEGNVVETTTTVTETTLYITVSHKTADEMADEYGFNADQRDQLAELLAEENRSLWSAVLYGIGTGDGEIVTVALSQLGNVGGQPYWSWYGFGSRVEWCACFVSWCANECGYIDTGVIPKFAGCVTGSGWFKDRGLWQDRNYEPRPGDIIFFDWNDENGQDGECDHVGIVEKVENGIVYTVEGNSGDSCRQRQYAVGYYEIYGYGTPAY